MGPGGVIDLRDVGVMLLGVMMLPGQSGGQERQGFAGASGRLDDAGLLAV